MLFDSSFSIPYACHEIDHSSCRGNVAVYLLSLFSLRFSHGGYAQGSSVHVGPLIIVPFFRAPDGQVRFPQSTPLDLTQFHGPFTCAIDCRLSGLKAELRVLKHRRTELLQTFDGDEALFNLGEHTFNKRAIQLVEV